MRRLVFSPVGLSVCLAPTLGEAWSSRMVYNYHFKREGEIRTRSTEYGEPRSRFPVIAVLRRSFPVAAPTRTGLAVGPGPPSGRGWGWGGERYFSTVPIPRTHHSERTPLPPCVAASSPRPGVCGSHQVPPLSPPLPQPSSAKTHAGYAVTPVGREALGAQRRAAGRGSVDPGSLAASTAHVPICTPRTPPTPDPQSLVHDCSARWVCAPCSDSRARRCPPSPCHICLGLTYTHLSSSARVGQTGAYHTTVSPYLPCHTPHRDKPPSFCLLESVLSLVR